MYFAKRNIGFNELNNTLKAAPSTPTRNSSQMAHTSTTAKQRQSPIHHQQQRSVLSSKAKIQNQLAKQPVKTDTILNKQIIFFVCPFNCCPEIEHVKRYI